MFLITAIFVGALAVPLVQANDAEDPGVSAVEPWQPAAGTKATLAVSTEPAAEVVEDPIGQCVCP